VTQESFGHVLERWHDYYLMVGTAAATLLGLLFVALSFNIDILLHDQRAHLMDLARQTFHVFITALIVALIALMPDLPDRIRGVDLAVIGTLLFMPTLRNLLRIRSQTDRTISQRVLIARTLAPLLASAILIYGGLCMFRRQGVDTLMTFSSASLLLLGSGAGSAWDLMVRVAKARRAQ